MKKIFALSAVLFSFFISNTFCEDFPSWKILEKAQLNFDIGNYSESLKLANESAKVRKNEILNEFNILEISLSSSQVKRAGNEIDSVIEVLTEREEKDSISIINKYVSLYTKDFFNDDVHVLAKWLKEKQNYPEAYYLIGQIYQIEGETEVALQFYQKALESQNYLDINECKFEILLSMAQIYKSQQKNDDLEKTLLLILDNDETFKNQQFVNSLYNTIKNDKPNSVNKLFILFSGYSKYSIKALYELSLLYDSYGVADKSLQLIALTCVEAFTHILEILLDRDVIYKFTDLEDFFNECKKYEDILEWARINNVFEAFYLFADKTFQQNYTNFATELFSILAKSLPDEKYKNLSYNKLKMLE